MKELELHIADGLVTYHINGKADIVFNPTDILFAKRLYNTFERMNAMQKEYLDADKGAEGAEAAEAANAFYNAMERLDGEARDLLDGVFGEGFCAKVFGETGVYAFADGLPLWANLLFAVLDEFDEAVTREVKLSDPRIKKYTDKYRKQ